MQVTPYLQSEPKMIIREGGKVGDEKGIWARTSSSLSLLHSFQPSSHLLLMRLTATRRLLAYSGRVPTMDCIVDMGVLGGRGPCQSQSQTVAKEPSPKALMGVKERIEAVKVIMRGERDRVGEKRTALCVSVLHTCRGNVESGYCVCSDRLHRCRCDAHYDL